MQIKIKKQYPDVRTPTYGTVGAACFDIYAYDKHSLDYSTMSIATIPSYSSCTFDTGLTFEVPDGHVMLVYSRSGHGFKNDIRLANCTGIIDSDYTGLLRVKLTNDGPHPFTVTHGDRIAQAMIIPVNQVAFDTVNEIKTTERGTGGCGSTGA